MGNLRPASRKQAPQAAFPTLDETTIQKTFTAVRTQLRMGKHATPHTLRHSYATHLVDAGVSLRTIQQILGHKSLRTTEVYMQVTQPGFERVQEAIDRLMVLTLPLVDRSSIILAHAC